jgi:hypothetical protein
MIYYLLDNKNGQAVSGSLINWLPESGSVIEDYESGSERNIYGSTTLSSDAVRVSILSFSVLSLDRL